MTGFVEHAREALRPVVDTPAALAECVASLAQGSGPVAFDAERAHGHRYWPKAYLFQVRRAGSGTWLIDPVAFETDGATDLSALSAACGDALWLVHAASQDLPCMRDDGIYPSRLFDTELAGRLLGEPAVSLGALLEAKVGVRLRKAHSADNWATRPLPPAWLDYAALDVDYLTELYEALHADLVRTGRLAWAEQEFEATLAQFSTPAEPRIDPWRRLSGITSLRHPRQLAVARALWAERDDIARASDRPPGRLLSDAAILEVASATRAEGTAPGPKELSAARGFQTRSAQRYRTNWVRALDAVATLPPSQYPARRAPSSGLPHPRSWERTNPDAAQLWTTVKPAVDELACDLGIQASLVAPSAIVQRVVYEHPRGADYASKLGALGARPWQVDFLAPLLTEALTPA